MCCEEWEVEAEFWYSEDWAGLVEHREKKAAKYPSEHNAQWALGEAYILNSNYDKALKLLSELHRKYPDSLSVQHSILDVLFATGKDENQFSWIIKPVVRRLTKEILDSCFKFLKPKRKLRTVEEVYLDLAIRDYLCFISQELLAAMKKDSRFIIDNPNLPPYDAEVRVNRQARSNIKK